MCPQLLIPLHRSVLGMQICDFAQRNSWQLEVSLNSVQMALKPLAPTALSAKKNLQGKKTKFAVVKANFLFRDKTKAKLLKLGPKTKLGTLPSQNFFDLLVEKQEKLEIQKKVNKVVTKVLWGLGSWLIYMHHHSG